MKRFTGYLVGLALVGVAILIGVSASAKERVDRMEKNTSINITYGTIVSLEDTDVKSEAASGAVLGGIIGAASAKGKSGERKVKSAAAGALIGALITRAAEGSHKATAVTIKRADGSVIKVVQDHTESLRVGDCVSVEEGMHTNVRLVSALMCDPGDHHEDAEVAESHRNEAAECIAAKEQLLEAETEEQFQMASNKVKILCH